MSQILGHGSTEESSRVGKTKWEIREIFHTTNVWFPTIKFTLPRKYLVDPIIFCL